MQDRTHIELKKRGEKEEKSREGLGEGKGIKQGKGKEKNV